MSKRKKNEFERTEGGVISIMVRNQAKKGRK